MSQHINWHYWHLSGGTEENYEILQPDIPAEARIEHGSSPPDVTDGLQLSDKHNNFGFVDYFLAKNRIQNPTPKTLLWSAVLLDYSIVTEACNIVT
jgi:hypothetical protein